MKGAGLEGRAPHDEVDGRPEVATAEPCPACAGPLAPLPAWSSDLRYACLRCKDIYLFGRRGLRLERDVIDTRVRAESTGRSYAESVHALLCERKAVSETCAAAYRRALQRQIEELVRGGRWTEDAQEALPELALEAAQTRWRQLTAN